MSIDAKERLCELSITYTIKSKLFAGLLIIVEFSSLMISLLRSPNLKEEYNVNQLSNSHSEFIKYLDPLFYLKLYYNSESYGNFTIYFISLQNFLINLGLSLFLFGPGFYFIKTSKAVDKKNRQSKWREVKEKICFLFVNFFDSFYHYFGINVYHCGFSLMKFCSVDIIYARHYHLALNITIIIFLLTFLGIASFLYFRFIKYNCIFFNYDKQTDLKNDTLFSVKYDIVLFISKIIIALEENLMDIKALDVAIIESSRNFLNYLKIIILFSFFIYIFVSVYRKRVLFIINNQLNTLRISLITFILLFYIVELSFPNEISSLIYYIFAFIICLLITSLASYWIYKVNLHNIFSNNNFVYPALFLFSQVNTGINKHDLKVITDEIKLIHFRKCQANDNCTYLCNYMNNPISSQNDPKAFPSTAISLIRAYLKEIKHHIRTKKHFLSKSELQNYKILKILISYSNAEANTPKLVFKLKCLKEKFADYEEIFSYNLNYLLQKENKKNNEMNKIAEIIEKYSETCKTLKQSLDELKDILIDIDNHNIYANNNLFESALLLNGQKRNCLANFQLFHTNKELYKDDYKLVMLSVVFQYLFNMENCFSDFNLERDSHDAGYISDKILNSEEYNRNIIEIKYATSDCSLVIQNASKALKDFKNRPLEETLYPLIKSELKSYFVKNMLNSQYDKFSVFTLVKSDKPGRLFHSETKLIKEGAESNKKDKEEYIQPVIFYFRIYPAFDLEEFTLLGRYELVNKEIIIVEKYKEKGEVILTYTLGISSYFLISPIWIQFLSKIGRKLNLNELFKGRSNADPVDMGFNTNNNLANKDISQISASKERTSICLHVDYSYLLKVITKHSGILGENFNEHEVTQVKNKIESLVNINYEFKVSMKREKEIGNYAVFSVQPCEKKNASGQLINQISEEEEADSFDTSHLNNQGSTMISAGSRANQDEGFKKGKKQKNSQDSLKNKHRSQLRTVTWLLVFVNLVVVFISFFYLFGIISKNTDLNELIELQNNFFLFQFDYTHVYLYSLTFYYIYNENSWDNSIYGYTFLQYLMRFPELDINYILPYLGIEYQMIVDNLQEKYLHFLLSADKFGQLNNLNYESSYKFISTVDFSIIEKKEKLFDILDINIENFRQGVRGGISLIYIINHEGKNFDNVYNKTVTSFQKIQYESLINYFNLHKLMNRLQEDISRNEEEVFDALYSGNIEFFIVNLAVHLFLILICVFTLRIFNSSIKEQNIVFGKRTSSERRKVLTEKLLMIGPLLDINYEIPKSNLEKLTELNNKGSNSKYKSGCFNSNSSKSNNSFNLISSKPLLHDNSNSSLLFDERKISLPLIKFILMIFSFYFLFIISFIIVFSTQFTSLRDIVKINELGSKFDNNLVTNILLTKISMLTNVTDHNLADYLLVNKEIPLEVRENGYIRNEVNKLQKLRTEYFTLLSNGDFDELMSVYYDVTCDYIYSQLDDEIYSKIRSVYKESLVSQNKNQTAIDVDMRLFSLIAPGYCRGLDVVKEDEMTLLMAADEIFYMNKKILNKYKETNSEYMKIKRVYDSWDTIDISNIFNFILRPLENYAKKEISKIIREKNQSYLSIIIFYLSINILLEIFFLFMIQKFLNSRIVQINSEISEFMAYF